MTLQLLRQELAAYYRPLRQEHIAGCREYQARRERIGAAMDRFDRDHPRLHPCLLKARLHELIAEHAEPVLFPHSPFFFELGVRPAENWGTPHPESAASWMKLRRDALCRDLPGMRRIRAASAGQPGGTAQLWLIWDAFDADHHCLGYTRLLRDGLNGILTDLAARRRQGCTAEQDAFLTAAERSTRALLRLAARFAERAREQLPQATDPESRRFLSLVAETADRVPAAPPRTFYEGLAALLFLREGVASLEGIGISVLGHLDRLLGDLCRDDLAAGRLDEAAARDLLARWMLPTDVKFHVADNPWPETSTCVELGGCDADGRPVCNDLTRLVVEAHAAHGLLNPKLNCRYSARSPAPYLEQLGAQVAAGHNHFAFLNDDVLIPALVRSGKSEREARLYVNGGCQETMVEGVEHSAGAYYYFNLARLLNLCLTPPAAGAAEAADPELGALLPPPLDSAPDYAAFHAGFFAALRRALGLGVAWAAEAGARWPQILPCPLFSCTLDGCIERAADYTTGAARHNPAGIALVGFGTLVDSLYAIREAVFARRWVTLPELGEALRRNWHEYEELRTRLAALPKFGHGDPGSDGLAAELAAELAASMTGLRNERGGPFQPSFFVYYMFATLGALTQATPDGRRHGDWLSQGVAPGRVRPPTSLTDVLRSLAHIDFTAFPGNAVLDVQLPAGDGLRGETVAALLRTFARLGGPTLQLNCVSPEALRDAQRHPAAHADLVVRISGLSAHFVALRRDVQDEIIARTVLRPGG